MPPFVCGRSPPVAVLHTLHRATPAWSWNVDLAHAVHLSAPGAGASRPCAQLAHAAEPVASLNLPAGQAAQPLHTHSWLRKETQDRRK